MAPIQNSIWVNFAPPVYTDIESFYLDVVTNTVGIVHRRLAEKIDVLLLHLLLLLNLAHHLLSFCNFLQSLGNLENSK